MTEQEVLQTLETLGTAQNRKVYRRHGVGDNMYGVSFANVGKLKKQIKTDHTLAQQLWNTGNHEARLLATMIADHKQIDEKLLAQWSSELDNYVITDAFSQMVSRTPHAQPKLAEWTAAEEEWIGRTGWSLLSHVAMNDPALPDDYFAPYLTTIEGEIHTRKNRVRDAMNAALIAIGMRNDDLEQQASAIAERIGKVEVDHGETNCKTPDAAAYIRKGRAHQRRKKAKTA